MMNKYLSLLLLISVLVIGVFGFTSMNHGADHSVGCIASAVDNTPCPENITEMSIHHIQAFVSFFSAVPSVPLIFLLGFLCLAVIGVRFLLKQRENYAFAYLKFRQYRRDPEHLIVRPRKITRWLSLLENSPSLHRASITNFNLTHLCKQKNLKVIKTTNSLIQKWQSILSAEWSSMQTALRQARTIKVKLTTFALSTAKITLQPIL